MGVTAKQIIEALGLVYIGEQAMPRGKPPGHMFNAGDYTLMVEGQVTPEKVAAKLAELEQRLVDANKRRGRKAGEGCGRTEYPRGTRA